MRAAAIIDDHFLADATAAGLNEPWTLWDLACAAAPERTAVVCPTNGPVTYATLVAEAEGLAAAWQTGGLASGDVVIVQLPN